MHRFGYGGLGYGVGGCGRYGDGVYGYGGYGYGYGGCGRYGYGRYGYGGGGFSRGYDYGFRDGFTEGVYGRYGRDWYW